MTTPSYAELVTAVRREGEGIAAAASMGIDATIPACDGWDVVDLVEHVSKIYARVGSLVSNRVTEQPDRVVELPAGEPVEVLRDLLDELVSALSESEPDTPVWNWDPSAPQVAAFWARRMAHESSVHRFDAQAAHGVMQPIDADLASDGIDELVDTLVHRIYGRDNVVGPTGTVRLHSVDHDAWLLQLTADGVHRIGTVDAPDVTANGTSSALLLAALGRVPWTALDVAGDVELLTSWSAAMNF